MLEFFLLGILAGAPAAVDRVAPDPVATQAIDDLDALYSMVELPTRTARRTLEAPSIVTVIRREDIEAYGARSAIDILRAVPGFEFGVDVVGLVGLSFRGIWVHEGKAQVMIDGMGLNDYGYGNISYFANTPASMIERVEIVRGPGSAMYGGFSEVAMVNFVTRRGRELNGVRMSGALTSLDGHNIGSRAEVSFGTQLGDVEMSASVGAIHDVYSRRLYRDFFGGSLPMGQHGQGKWDHVVAQASARGFRLGYRRTNMTHGGQDGFAAIVAPQPGNDAEAVNNYIEGALISYAIGAADRLTITPEIEASHGNTIGSAPYAGSQTLGQYSSGADLWRYRAELRGTYELGWGGEITAGVGYIRDIIKNVGVDADATSVAAAAAGNNPVLAVPGVRRTIAGDNTELRYTAFTESKFALAQYIVQLGGSGVGLTAGGRYEHTTFGSAFAPRLGATLTSGSFNAKALAGLAFRIPLPWQAYSRFLSVDSGSRLRPETARTYELELGYRLAQGLGVRANAFWIDIDSPIVYVGADNAYNNYGVIESLGFEAEAEWRRAEAAAYVNVSYARPGARTSPKFTTWEGGRFLGATPLKVNVGGTYRLPYVEVGPSLTVLSPRHGQSPTAAAALAADPTLVAARSADDNVDSPALTLLNVALLARNVLRTASLPLDARLSLHNALGAPYTLLQPYYGGHAPLPLNDRQVLLELTWHVG